MGLAFVYREKFKKFFFTGVVNAARELFPPREEALATNTPPRPQALGRAMAHLSNRFLRFPVGCVDLVMEREGKV